MMPQCFKYIIRCQCYNSKQAEAGGDIYIAGITNHYHRNVARLHAHLQHLSVLSCACRRSGNPYLCRGRPETKYEILARLQKDMANDPPYAKNPDTSDIVSRVLKTGLGGQTLLSPVFGRALAS